MARIRTVKPELFKHEQLYEAEKKYELPLRLAFIGLFTKCDREGRFKWRPRELKLDIAPYDEIDFSKVLDALMVEKFIIKYEVDGELYGCIPSWQKHQVINNKERKSELPALCVNDEMPTREEGVACASTTPLLFAQGEGKGKEGKGKEHIRKVSNETSQLSSTQEMILEVFNHWHEKMNHPRAKLDKNRQRKIKKALESGYTVDQLKQAIDGCANSPFNMGANDNKQRYDGINLIFRDAEHIERFIQNASAEAEMKNADKTIAQIDQISVGAI